ncbi:MAG: BamA/TamA family outer membrane protein, partial [Planctomycetota bacterium]
VLTGSGGDDLLVGGQGNDTLTSIGVNLGYTQIDNTILPSKGYKLGIGWEGFGLLGGDERFDKYNLNANVYVPLYRDLKDRPWVLEFRGDAGITEDAPFYEAFFAGGFNSLRGFRFRGVSPRSGPDDDAIGGDYILTGTAQLGFPLYQETLRGVVFSDFGSVSENADLGVIRVSAGAGIRLTLDPLGGLPLAFDLAWPINERDEDDRQVFSFSLGILQ